MKQMFKKFNYLKALRALIEISVGGLLLLVACKTGYEMYIRPLQAGKIEHFLIDVPAYVAPYKWVVNTSYTASALLVVLGLWDVYQSVKSCFFS